MAQRCRDPGHTGAAWMYGNGGHDVVPCNKCMMVVEMGKGASIVLDLRVTETDLVVDIVTDGEATSLK